MTTSVAQHHPKTLEEIVAKMTASQRLEKFKAMLRDRGMTIDRLARQATRQEGSRAHVSQVLSGKRSGKSTWPFLVDMLTHDELVVLGRDSRGQAVKVKVESRKSETEGQKSEALSTSQAETVIV
jgi:hypothetical protein